MSNQTKYNSFRKTYPEFVYEDYRYDVQSDGLHIVFDFRVGQHGFHPSAFIPNRPFLCFDQPKTVLDTLIFNIGMIELISYWKAFCPPNIKVECGPLDEAQKDFWRKIYFNGLGEFFYINGIVAQPQDFFQFVVHSDNAATEPFATLPSLGGNYLVPIGGGKDSVVTLEHLQEATEKGLRPVPLIMNPRGATVHCIEAAGYTIDDALIIHRTIDPHLLKLNSQGCLNGHTPFSAMLAFYSLLCAQLSGIPNIALSNEWSANESTVAGTGINHQYSKSLTFENDFRCYYSKHISPCFNYFSYLRPLSELQIAMLFSQYDKYHMVFRSCNAGSKQDIWCGKCAKCLFAFIILSPFLSPRRLSTIFGNNLLDDPELDTFFKELIGQGETKPFECVGTVDEVNAALSMAIDRWYNNQRPVLLRDYKPQPILPSLAHLAGTGNLSPQLLHLLTNHVQAAANR